MPRKRAGLIGCGSVGISFLITLVALATLLLDVENKKGGVSELYNWVTAGSFSLNMSILIDPLSVFMLLIVTGVGFVIHVYSIGYMENDPEFSRFGILFVDWILERKDQCGSSCPQSICYECDRRCRNGHCCIYHFRSLGYVKLS